MSEKPNEENPAGDIAPAERKAALRAWWLALKADKGERAHLRRCGGLAEVCFSPAYHRLLRDLAPFGWRHREGLAMVAAVLAHVKEDQPGTSVAAQMAAPRQSSDSARVSGLRFRRMLREQAREALLPSLIRVVHLLGDKVDIASLAEAAYYWNDTTRNRWAFDYYAKAPREV